MSEDCLLPCSFRPSSKDTITWFRQDVVVYKLERDDDNDDDDDEDDDDEDDDDSSSKEHFEHEQLAGRASMFPRLLSRGNARLLLRRTGLKDRGTYRCHVTTSEGEHNAKVILKVEGELSCPNLAPPPFLLSHLDFVSSTSTAASLLTR